ncbi:MAG: hypothetical protein ABR585_15050, partial [Gemmatimonadaceae bacterium]
MISFLRTILVWVIGTAATVVLGISTIIAALLGVKDKPGGIYDTVPRWWASTLLWASGVKVRLHGVENATGSEHHI